MEKVLIAEDDRIHLMRLTNGLGKHANRFEVVPAKDGQEAIDILQKQRIDVLVTDIQMPRIDGLVLLAYVSEHHSKIPCFVMSAYGTPEMKAKLPKDLLQFFAKPFEIEDLARAIIEVLERDTALEGLQAISVESFLHMIMMEQASCIFEIKSPGKPTGLLYFENGVLLDAECGDLSGEAAALELIPRKQASFGLKFYPAESVNQRIFADLNQLIRQVTG